MVRFNKTLCLPIKIGETGRKAETRSAKRLGAKPRRGSGSGVCAKADFEAGEFLIEHKSTEKASIRVEHRWLAKVMNEAQAQGLTPAVQVVFVRGDGRPKPAGSWVMVPEWRFKEMINGG